MNKNIQIGRIKTSRVELIDISKAWIVLSLAFALIFGGISIFRGNLAALFSMQFLNLFLISLFTAGLGFLFHELAHKFVAQRYGCTAEFRAMDQMLYLALGLALLMGFLFAAPGAVMISGMITRKENGIISAAGPLTNYALGLVFVAFLSFSVGNVSEVVKLLSLNINQLMSLPISIITAPLIAFKINLWLGLFNMIPFLNFDGKKILDWNRYVWIAMVLFGIVFLFVI